MHTLTACAAAMRRHHSAVLLLVKHNAQLAQPVNRQRSVGYQFFQQLGNIFVVTAAKGIQIMLRRGIVAFIRSLNTALGHHRVGIAHTQLGNYEDVCTAVMCFQRSGSTGTAATDNQNINVIVHFFQIKLYILQAAFALQQLCQFYRHLLSLVWTNLQNLEALGTVVRMELLQQLVLFLCRKAFDRSMQTLGTGSFNLSHRF